MKKMEEMEDKTRINLNQNIKPKATRSFLEEAVLLRSEGSDFEGDIVGDDDDAATRRTLGSLHRHFPCHHSYCKERRGGRK